jgi:hypothetical protein
MDAPAPTESVAVGVRDAESVAVGARDGLALRLTVPEAVADGVSDAVAVGDGERVALGVVVVDELVDHESLPLIDGLAPSLMGSHPA